MGQPAGDSKELRFLLAVGLESFALEHPDVERLLDSFQLLIQLLLRWSKRIDLTGHRSPEAVVRRLVFDAFGLASLIPPARSLADVGSGAGFPGLPLALLRPGLSTTLIEARLRRHHFQRAAARSLGISNVRLLHGRAEQLQPEPHQVVVAQAVARPERALEWMLRWAAPGGWLVLPLGSVERPIRPPADVQGGFSSYRLPNENRTRFVWLGRLSNATRGDS